jgi:hypothetical protein
VRLVGSSYFSGGGLVEGPEAATIETANARTSETNRQVIGLERLME